LHSYKYLTRKSLRQTIYEGVTLLNLKKFALLSAVITCFSSFAMATDLSPREDNETQLETISQSPMKLDDSSLEANIVKACKTAGRACLPVENYNASLSRSENCKNWDSTKPCGSYSGNVNCATHIACSQYAK
jgi:hypothetical protein